MLRTNSKKAKENIRKYVIESYNSEFDACSPNNYVKPGEHWSRYAHNMYYTFYIEKLHLDNRYKANKITEYELFEEWVSGLCGFFQSEYYYNLSAVEILGDILEETTEERNKFTEMQACEMLTKLIYREMKACIK